MSSSGGVGISLNGVVGFIPSHSMDCDAAALAARRPGMLNESPPLFREAALLCALLLAALLAARSAEKSNPPEAAGGFVVAL